MQQRGPFCLRSSQNAGESAEAGRRANLRKWLRKRDSPLKIRCFAKQRGTYRRHRNEKAKTHAAEAARTVSGKTRQRAFSSLGVRDRLYSAAALFFHIPRFLRLQSGGCMERLPKPAADDIFKAVQTAALSRGVWISRRSGTAERRSRTGRERRNLRSGGKLPAQPGRPVPDGEERSTVLWPNWE